MFKQSLKKGINTFLNTLGYEIRKCQVPEKNRYLWLKKHRIRTIFDIGANTGEWAATIHEHFPEATIYAFEPLSNCFAKLSEKEKTIPNLIAFNFALGDTPGKVPIYRSSQASSSSLLPMSDLHKKAFPHTKKLTREDVEVRTLDQMSKGLEIEKNIFIKIDVQGFELNVLRGGKTMLNRARVLLVETSFHTLYDNQPLFDEVYSFLKTIGFRYMGDFESIKSPIDGAILQANAIFVNTGKE